MSAWRNVKTLGHVETERDVSILHGGYSHGSNGRRKPGTLVAPTLSGLNPDALGTLKVRGRAGDVKPVESGPISEPKGNEDNHNSPV